MATKTIVPNNPSNVVEIKKHLAAGQKATMVVKESNAAAARTLLATLPLRIRALVTLRVEG